MSCIFHAQYTMYIDVYTQSSSYDPDFGEQERNWDYNNPVIIEGIARPIQSDGIRVVGSSEEWERNFVSTDWIKIKVQERLTRRDRVGNIRDKNSGDVIWNDDEVTVPGMLFDVRGVTPQLDPFGAITEYEILAKKVQNP